MARRYYLLSNIHGESQDKKVSSCIQVLKSAARLARSIVSGVLIIIACIFIVLAGMAESEEDDDSIC